MRWKEGGGRGCQNSRTCWDTVREDVSVKGPRAGEAHGSPGSGSDSRVAHWLADPAEGRPVGALAQPHTLHSPVRTCVI